MTPLNSSKVFLLYPLGCRQEESVLRSGLSDWKRSHCHMQVVGVHMVGPDTPEIMQGVGIALKCRATKAQFDSTIGIHPTAAEEIVTMRTKSRTVKGKAEAKADKNESRSNQQ